MYGLYAPSGPGLQHRNSLYQLLVACGTTEGLRLRDLAIFEYSLLTQGAVRKSEVGVPTKLLGCLELLRKLEAKLDGSAPHLAAQQGCANDPLVADTRALSSVLSLSQGTLTSQFDFWGSP